LVRQLSKKNRQTNLTVPNGNPRVTEGNSCRLGAAEKKRVDPRQRTAKSKGNHKKKQTLSEEKRKKPLREKEDNAGPRTGGARHENLKTLGQVATQVENTDQGISENAKKTQNTPKLHRA